MRWAGHVAQMEAMKNVYKILVQKPDGNGIMKAMGLQFPLKTENFLTS
jgi:hypothetical protein